MSVRVLNSWKEIASYLNRGVRTVQRWERDLNLPVRRPRGRSRSAVIAIADDLDAWVKRTPLPDDNIETVRAIHTVSAPELKEARKRLRSMTEQLRLRTNELRMNVKLTHELTEDMVERRTQLAKQRHFRADVTQQDAASSSSD
ncbi:MAG TPA: hypothetical protein VFP40_15980 [Terriglobales bacterium]|nr:hypothetical protein [Terriglobales bacterium]